VKISMSALRIPIRVTRTLNVPTMRVLIAVLANKDSLEMEHLAKISMSVLQMPTRAIKMQFASTPMVLRAALANKDSLEME